jgi:hypothetical protein
MENEFVVSIVLPVQGSEQAFNQCVRAVLGQSESRWQLLLAVSSGTRVWAEAWAQRDARIQVLQDEVTGRAAALRAGLALCRGRFTVFLDTEHVWSADFLALTAAFLTGHPLEDMVCMESHTPDGRSTVLARPSLYRESGPLASKLDGATGLPRDAVWRGGELADHLRWGEYTRLAVTLLRTEFAELLLPALQEESAALDYRLQAKVAAKCAVNLLALAGALHQPGPTTPEQLRQREMDALTVFDEVHGRQLETDLELDHLRSERIARIDGCTPLRALLRRLLGFLQVDRSQSRQIAAELGGQPVDQST